MTERPLAAGRAAFERRAWTEACDAFSAAETDGHLDYADLERAALAAYLIGRDEVAEALWVRAHHAALQARDLPRAARLAFWSGMLRLQRGDLAVAGGWLGRASSLIEDADIDCAERGYLFVPRGLQALEAGDAAAALAAFERAGQYGQRFADPDLSTLSRLGRGQALIGSGDLVRGVALLDEAMLAVTSDEVGPIIVGIVYCASIEAFHAIFDVRRAQEWTEALTDWCATQPDLVPFRGRCLVYRAELMRFHGAWPEATEEARRAEAWLSRPPPEPALGEALYEQAELHRLQGRFAAAERTYREAGRWGRPIEAGLARLRLGQGRPDDALTMVRRALEEEQAPTARTALLVALVDAALASGAVDVAGSAATELASRAGVVGAPLLWAIADGAAGVVELAMGHDREALRRLRRAAATWQRLDAPYELARVRVSIGVAIHRLGDAEASKMAFDAARETFRVLRADADLARLEALAGVGQRGPGDLSARELEVLRLVADGLTNRAIAQALGISMRTVDRHVSNVFTKLGVPSRAAATAAAYERGLV
jgi:DNA-binding NarL/FixJ family response regulator